MEPRDRALASFATGIYAGALPGMIRDEIVREGWQPVLIDDLPGTAYPEHEHIESKLLVFLEGSMIVDAGGEQFRCGPGDRLMIPGSVRHAALVGDEGCSFFWSKQVRGSL